MKRRKLIQGVGINDGGYNVNPTINGKQGMCKYYRVWKGMFERCYSAKFHEKYPTYIGCSVDPRWHSFKVFKRWMEKHDWEGMHLDKDLLHQGNKLYCPDTCMFVPAVVNTFVIDSGASRGEWPIGVCFHKRANKFKAECRNPFTGDREYLGLHDGPNKAHQVWLKRKKELQVELAETITDNSIKAALLNYKFL